jgi:NAD(P)-dependent dehydrogenase (short-subunit alcohol dehydrogenase family)
MSQMRDELAVVVGAAGGIGRELVRLLAGANTPVALVDVDGGRLAEARATVASDRVVGTYVVDVTNESQVLGMADRIHADIGPPTMLINCVGWLGPLGKTTWEYTQDDWQRVLAVNLLGPISCVRAFLPGLEAGNGPCRIVLLSSLGAFYASPALGAYAAAKRALVSYAETLELELINRGSHVRVSVVSPGSVPTDLNLALREARGELDPNTGEWLDAADVARKVIDSIPDNRFYVFTHPSSRARFEPYRDRIMASF